MHGQLQPRETDNKASSNKRSAAAAKCQAIPLDDNGTETSHKSGVWLHSAAPFHEQNSQLVVPSPKRLLNMNVKSPCVILECGAIMGV